MYAPVHAIICMYTYECMVLMCIFIHTLAVEYICIYVCVCIPKNPDDEAENCSVYANEHCR